MTTRRIPVLLTLTAVLALSVSCQRVPLLAPSGSTITLTTGVTALPVNGTAEIVAQVIEPSGTPPQHGTHVTFTTTLGTIQPPEAETDISGRVLARFIAGTSNGTATITAISGGASTGTAGAIKIAVGTAAVGRVTVNASPASVPNTGGSTTITASVFDINGNALSSAPVSFSTTAGTLSASQAIADALGVATTVLTTSLPATVTASVGAQAPATGGTGAGGGTTTTTPPASGQSSGSVNVTISAAPALVITPPTPPPSAGLPASFTFAVTVATTNGSAVRDVIVNWGDGSRPQSLGAISGNAVVSHVYNKADTYLVTGTVTDAAGNSSTVSTSVTVIPVPRPTIIITPSPRTVPGGGTITFSIQITAPAGIGIVSTTIDFGDGSSAALGGASSASVPHDYAAGNPGTRTVKVTVVDTTGQTTEGTTSVTITQ